MATRKYREENKEHIRAYEIEYRKTHKPVERITPERRRINQLKIKYHLTVERYEAILSRQKGVCAICKRLNASGRRLGMDHDHDCCPTNKRSCGKCLRGLLCFVCNTRLEWYLANKRAIDDYLDFPPAQQV